MAGHSETINSPGEMIYNKFTSSVLPPLSFLNYKQQIDQSNTLMIDEPNLLSKGWKVFMPSLLQPGSSKTINFEMRQDEISFLELASFNF
jgi:hypothetical protein